MKRAILLLFLVFNIINPIVVFGDIQEGWNPIDPKPLDIKSFSKIVDLSDVVKELKLPERVKTNFFILIVNAKEKEDEEAKKILNKVGFLESHFFVITNYNIVSINKENTLNYYTYIVKDDKLYLLRFFEQSEQGIFEFVEDRIEIINGG